MCARGPARAIQGMTILTIVFVVLKDKRHFNISEWCLRKSARSSGIMITWRVEFMRETFFCKTIVTGPIRSSKKCDCTGMSAIEMLYFNDCSIFQWTSQIMAHMYPFGSRQERLNHPPHFPGFYHKNGENVAERFGVLKAAI